MHRRRIDDVELGFTPRAAKPPAIARTRSANSRHVTRVPSPFVRSATTSPFAAAVA
jgi:hypothetical protein